MSEVNLTPLPSEGEALQRLIEKWRESADVCWPSSANEPVGKGEEQVTYGIRAETLRKCASQLEAALAPLAGPVDASGEPLDRIIGCRICGKRPVTTGLVFTAGELRMCDQCYDELRAAAAVPSSPAQEGALHGLEHRGVHSVGDSNRPYGMECVSSNSPLPPSSPAQEPFVPNELAKIRAMCIDAGLDERCTTLSYIQGVFYRLRKFYRREW